MLEMANIQRVAKFTYQHMIYVLLLVSDVRVQQTQLHQFVKMLKVNSSYLKRVGNMDVNE